MRQKKVSLIRRCRLSLEKQKALLLLFSVGATARAAARAAGVNRNTATRIFRLFRIMIYLSRITLAPFTGNVEIDECYISGGQGGRRVSRQGRSLAGKFAIVGVAQRCPETGTRRARFENLRRVNTLTLSDFALTHVERGSEIHTDQFAAYKLAPLGYVHKRVNHSLVFKNFKTGACTNNIESAWGVFKRHLRRFCGGWRHNLTLWLRESEMRYECGVDTFFDKMKKLVREMRDTVKKALPEPLSPGKFKTT